MPTLRIVCINDVYSLENLPRLRTLITHLRATRPADCLITTLAGDFVAPSMLSSLDFGRGMIDCMNAVPIDYVTFGNHEDDIPLAELSRRVTEFRGVWLATNVPGFTPDLPRYAELTVGRVRIALLGVVMNDEAVYRARPFGVPVVLSPNDTAEAETETLRGMGFTAVIPLTHQSLADDRELLHRVQSPPFPVIIGGHEHVPILEETSGTWIVKAGSDATHAVVVDLAWADVATPGGTDTPVVTVWLEELAQYGEDAALRARVDGHMKAVHELEAATLRRVAPDAPLSSVGARWQQTTMGTMICSHVRDALEADGCLFNAGGIRGAREYPTRFTYGDLKAEVPFENEVVVARLPGRVLREAIAASRAQAPIESGGFLQIDDGMTVVGTTLTHVRGAPLSEDANYRIGVVRNLLTGLDHIEPLVRFAKEYPECVPEAGSGREIKQLLVHSLSLALWQKLGEFDVLDANHDGSVDPGEIAVAVARVLAEPASDMTVELVLRAVDADRDRLVSRAEAREAAKHGGGGGGGPHEES